MVILYRKTISIKSKTCYVKFGNWWVEESSKSMHTPFYSRWQLPQVANNNWFVQEEQMHLAQN